MKKGILWLLLLALLAGTDLSAQTPSGEFKFWVFLTDKQEMSEADPGQYLSPKSLARRERMGLKADRRDLPVSPAYIQQLRDMGLEVCRRSRWLNAVSVRGTRSQLAALNQLAFVREVRPVQTFEVDIPEITEIPAYKNDYNAGITDHALSIIGANSLHMTGYNGKGITIAVMDNGFRNVDENEVFKHIFDENRLLATYDFVNNEEDVYDQGNHGAWVLSILAGNLPGYFTGAAPQANFILCHTENDATEGHAEEDNWVAAAEWADSLGADIFSTSLGYSRGMQDTLFWGNDTIVNWSYSHMDGNTTIITRAADLAASRGILVVNSAGNEGSGAWKYVTAPADGDSVLAVGAVDSTETLVGFSSRGPTYDGRIKPDLCAMGGSNYFITTGGNLAQGSGTSFSCPMMSGLAACLWQADPSLSNMELFEILKRSADRFDSPDNNYGYGIPDGLRAFDLIRGEGQPGLLGHIPQLNENGYGLAPNPADEYFSLIIDSQDSSYNAVMELIPVDLAGRQVKKLRFNLQVPATVSTHRFERSAHYPGLPSGIYVVRAWREDTGEVLMNRKLVLERR